MQNKHNWILIAGFPNEKQIRNLAVNILKVAQRLKLLSKKSIILDISCASLMEIKALNKKFRKMNTPTDVLSFENPDVRSRSMSGHRFIFLGNIVICHVIAKKQALQYRHSYKNEIAVLLTHALLHLLGFDHEKSSKSAKIMQKWESKILKNLKVKNGLIQRTMQN